jgi:phosphoenolpyruvate carboxykinase (GTP)
MASETTAANIDTVGVVRRDSMAMKPFCGYNFADYFSHWLSFAGTSDKLPKIFHVNWFRKDADGNFMWPGFGENMRVLEWMIRRCRGEASCVETPIGRLPAADDLRLDGIEVDAANMAALLDVDVESWKAEMADIGEYLSTFGDRTPPALEAERAKVVQALDRA